MVKDREELEALDRSVRKAFTETGGRAHKIVAPSTAGGDPERLRNIPAIGPNVEGAVPGTRPDRVIGRRRGRMET